MGVQACSGMAAITALTCGFIATLTEKNAPAARGGRADPEHLRLGLGADHQAGDAKPA